MISISLNAFTQDTNFPLYIQYGFHDTDLFMHNHTDFSELVIVLQGTALHKVDSYSYPIKKGDVFVISNNTSHGYENPLDFRICNIMYQKELLASDLDLRKLAGFHALFVIEPYLSMEHSFQSRLKLQMSDFYQINNIIDCMIEEYANKADGWKTMIISCFKRLAVFLSRAYGLTSFEKKYDIINIAKSVSYIEHHFTNSISIEELAALSNLSVRHFTRIFRDTYETTPGNYILASRMKHACSQLKNTPFSISEIAFQSGFNDSNYFTRQFRKLYNVTPKQYRESNKVHRANAP